MPQQIPRCGGYGIESRKIIRCRSCEKSAVCESHVVCDCARRHHSLHVHRSQSRKTRRKHACSTTCLERQTGQALANMAEETRTFSGIDRAKMNRLREGIAPYVDLPP